MEPRRLCVVLVLLAAALALAPGVQAAPPYNNTTVDYYDNSSTAVDSSSWIDGRTEATVDNYAHYISRVGTFVVGGASGSENVVLTGLIAAVALGVLAALAGVGFVGGAVLAIIVTGALVISGFAPMWLYAIGLFAIGALGTALMRRALR